VNARPGIYVDPVVDANRVLEKSFEEMRVKNEKQMKQKGRNDELRYAIQRCITTDDIHIFIG
jgi:hypothetical protein